MPTHYQGAESERRALDVFIKLVRAADSVSLKVNAHLQGHNLTVSQFGVLESLYHLGPMQTSELGTKILKSSGNMTTVIDNLEKRGLVERIRREDDRRCIDIHLTAAARKLVEGLLPGHVAGVQQAFACLTADEQEKLGALCRTLGLYQL
jgi:MarR family 2-MHQ and catechol resistance regulon transcriptional repressor